MINTNNYLAKKNIGSIIAFNVIKLTTDNQLYEYIKDNNSLMTSEIRLWLKGELIKAYKEFSQYIIKEHEAGKPMNPQAIKDIGNEINKAIQILN